MEHVRRLCVEGEILHLVGNDPTDSSGNRGRLLPELPRALAMTVWPKSVSLENRADRHRFKILRRIVF